MYKKYMHVQPGKQTPPHTHFLSHILYHTHTLTHTMSYTLAKAITTHTIIRNIHENKLTKVANTISRIN